MRRFYLGWSRVLYRTSIHLAILVIPVILEILEILATTDEKASEAVLQNRGDIGLHCGADIVSLHGRGWRRHDAAGAGRAGHAGSRSADRAGGTDFPVKRAATESFGGKLIIQSPPHQG